MGRPNYVCTTCEEHFTWRYSATRHNITLHGNRGEIVSLVEYLVGRSSGRYRASHPFWYRRRSKQQRIHNLEATTLADSMGDTFRPPGLQREQQGQYQYQYHQQSLEEQERYHRRQQQQSVSPSIPPSPAAIQDHPPNDLPCPSDPIFQSQSMITMDDEETTTLSQETTLKIAELKRLIYRYPQYHHNPAAVINCVIHFCNNGDNTLLDEKLEQLRTFDRAMGYTRM
ncbi:MAG: hypothetical protein WAM42_13770 [Candidatus Nitrosopolaris sp.]